jgi:MFS family permease
MLHDWHDFYVLLGTASAALIALLFVAASIGTGLISSQRSTATRTYMSPIIFHYTFVLFISLMALVPDMTDAALAAIVIIVALAGIGFSIAVLIGVVRSAASDLADRFGYGASPLGAYAAALAAAGFLFAHSTVGPNVLAGALVLLLLVNIRNAWDLTITFVQRHTDGKSEG